MSDPVLIRAGAPDLQTWDDERRGTARFRLLVDASGGPSAGLVQILCEFAEGETEKPHSHDIPESGHVLSGSGTVTLGGRTQDVAAGDTVFVPPGMTHSWVGGAEGLRLLATFPADRYDRIDHRFEEAE